MHQPAARPDGGRFVTFISTAVAAPTYVFLWLLARFTPDYPLQPRVTDGAAGPPVFERYPRSARFARLFLTAYQASAVNTYMHRNGPRCHFIPSCSEYPVLAIRKYGLWRGLWMSGARFRRCHPGYNGDYLDFP